MSTHGSARLTSIERFTPFVSPLVQRRLARSASIGLAPEHELLEGVVLLADVTGFTSLTESLSKSGPAGAETVKDVLNNCFTPLIGLVNEHGGDVLQFAGDAVLAFFPAVASADLDGLNAAAVRADAAALAIQKRVDSMTMPDGTPLRLRIGLGAGPMRSAIVGGVESRRFSLVSGDALAQAVDGVRRAMAGEIVLSAPAQQLLARRAMMIPRTMESLPLPPEAEVSLKSFVPRAVQARIDAGQTDWLAEFRRITTVFVGIRGAAADVDTLDRIARAMQAVVYRQGGTVNQFLIDDKGTTLLAGWGLPAHTHDDDPARAVSAAIAIRDELVRAGFACGIGIATGPVFTGIRGSGSRCEYGMVGDTVNLAARLMEIDGGGVFCDAATRASARQRFIFQSMAPVSLKGRASPVALYRPIREKKHFGKDQREFIGRVRERHALAEALRDVERGHSAVAILEGEPGIGKSRLATDLIERVQSSVVRAVVANGDALERSAPLHAWRRVITGLLGAEDDKAAARARLLSLLEPDAALVACAPLVNAVVPLDLPDTAYTAALSAEARAERTRDLLTHLFKRLATGGAVLILEDAQWFDSASWGLAEALWRAAPPLLVVIVTRPLIESELPPEASRLIELAGELRFKLDGFDDEDIVVLACQRLEVDELPEAVARLICERAEGHPFFAEELASTLRERGLVKVEQGECHLAAAEEELGKLGAGTTIQTVVTGRIDRLSAREQLTLKVASVFGRTFAAATLADIHPIEDDRASISKQIARMSHLELLEQAGGEGEYRFKHAIIQQVAYDLLPFAERRQLHRALAEWYEETPEEGRATLYALLAHHWSAAENRTKALDYLERAGVQALERDNNMEAVRFFTEALAVHELPAASPAVTALPILQSRWHMHLGQARFQLRQSDLAVAHLKRVLDLLRMPVPDSGAGSAWFLARQIATQARDLMFGRPAKVRDGERLSIAAAAASQLAWINMVRRDAAGLAMMSLLAVNLADRAGMTSVFGLALLGVMSSAMNMRGLGRRYFDRAHAEGKRSATSREMSLVVLFDAMDLMGAGDLPRSIAVLREAVATSRRGGSRAAMTRQLSLLGGMEAYVGQMNQASESVRESRGLLGSEAAHDRFHVLNTFAIIDAYRLTGAEGLAQFRALEPELTAHMEPGDALARNAFVSARAVLSFRGGAFEEAARDSDESFDLTLKGFRTTSAAFHTVIQGVPMVFVGLWERARSAGQDVTAIAAKTRRSARLLARFAKANPVYQARLLIVRGQIAALSGHPVEARKLWQQGGETARRLHLRYDEALANFELGRSYAKDSPERLRYLETARSLFVSGGARYEIGLIDGLAS